MEQNLSIKECRMLINKALEYFANQGYKKFNIKEEFLDQQQIPQGYIDNFLQNGSIAEGQKIYAYQIVVTHNGTVIMAHISVGNLFESAVSEARTEKKNLFLLFPKEQLVDVWNSLINVFITHGFMAIRDFTYERMSQEATSVA